MLTVGDLGQSWLIRSFAARRRSIRLFRPPRGKKRANTYLPQRPKDRRPGEEIAPAIVEREFDLGRLGRRLPAQTQVRTKEVVVDGDAPRDPCMGRL